GQESPELPRGVTRRVRLALPPPGFGEVEEEEEEEEEEEGSGPTLLASAEGDQRVALPNGQAQGTLTEGQSPPRLRPHRRRERALQQRTERLPKKNRGRSARCRLQARHWLSWPVTSQRTRSLRFQGTDGKERPAPCQALERFCVHPRGALSAEPPEVTVTRRAGQDDTETLTCRAHGFYPREIDMAWTRDGEVWLQDAFRGVLAPNSDGTFHAWLSVRLDPWDIGHFLCCVEHDALQTPVELTWEEPASILDHLIWPTMGVLVLLPAVVLAVLSLKTLCGAYGPASSECVPLLLGLSKAGQAPLGCIWGPGRIR
ncbi:saoe class I histocompatibility antigen, A alpha chain-like, partial [Varanus komodoensis]|uniref:saoe class I histocompatibility antigen, A alpha chain-like n=1 Tax=Varanus komodoensis TaxID=61221 RepID=UPI001CF78CC2